MSSKERGLYGKYYVERTDGKPITGPTFTLELWRDPLSLAAYRAYIDAARDAGYAALADDMSAVLGEAERHHADRSAPTEAEAGHDDNPSAYCADCGAPLESADIITDGYNYCADCRDEDDDHADTY